MTWSDLTTHIRHLNAAEHAIIRKAFDMGKAAHEGQIRKSGEPYFIHPIAVAGILGDMGADAETVSAALLHDTVEDTKLTPGEIKEVFGSTVVSLVDGVTKLNKEHFETQPSLDEKIETLRKIFTLMQKDVRIMVIKLADRLHNMRTAQYVEEGKRKKLIEETQEVYVKIAEQLSMHAVKNDLEEAILSIQQPDRIGDLRAARKQHDTHAQSIIKKLHTGLVSHFSDLMLSVTMKGESESWNKLELYGHVEGDTQHSPDVTIVYVCPSIDACYRTMGALHQLWKRETLSFHDLINAPLLNGYKAVHTTIILPTGERVHCKIRTVEMDAYAERGIATKCFDGKALGVADYLPWTRLINPLTEDTKKRSDEFWESLKSDILGDSITVHGPDDGTAIIPSNSTALDAVFYLFGKLAPRVSKIRVNGEGVPFDHPLRYADSIFAEVSEEQQLTHEWLRLVRTGFALAQIRHALRKEPQDKKEHFAKASLQQYMSQQHKGFLIEYDEKKMAPRVAILGYDSLNKALAAVADGELDIINLYEALFTKAKPTKQIDYSIRLHTPKETAKSLELLQYIHQVCKPVSLRMRRGKDGSGGTLWMHLRLPMGQQLNILRDLGFQGASAMQLESFRDRRVRYLLCALLMLLWGMDPVYSYAILQSGVTPIDFSLIRLVSVFIIATGTLIVSRLYYPLSHVPLRRPSIWIAGIAFFGVSVLTYFALRDGSPALYNAVLRGNVLLIAFTETLRNRKSPIPRWPTAIMLGGYVLLFLSNGFSEGFKMSLGVLAAFFIYTIASARFQKQEKVLARYPQFFFYTTGIALLMGIILTGWSRPLALPIQTVAEVAVYSACFIGLPYVLFYWLTKKYGYAVVSPWIALSLIVTLIGQATFYGFSTIMLIILPAPLLILGSLFSAKKMDTKEEI